MGMKGITMNTAPEDEPHIYAEDDAAIYQSICGPDGVFDIGQRCESQVISNNKVRVKDGVLIMGGHFARIPYGEYEDCEIANGQSGKNRNDIIIGKFITTGLGGIDTMSCEVKQGTATDGTASDPELVQEDLYNAGKTREVPLYRVKLEGLNIVAVEPLFEVIPSIPAILIPEKLDESLFAFQDFWTVMEFHTYKIGKTIYFNGEFLYTGSILQPDVLYSLNSGSADPSVKPEGLSHLTMVATDSGYKNAVPGFAMITTDGEIKYSMPGKVQKYLFISGTYMTA